jgi:hypothetical protein
MAHGIELLSHPEDSRSQVVFSSQEGFPRVVSELQLTDRVTSEHTVELNLELSARPGIVATEELDEMVGHIDHHPLGETSHASLLTRCVKRIFALHL